jgi:hypothetical protein
MVIREAKNSPLFTAMEHSFLSFIKIPDDILITRTTPPRVKAFNETTENTYDRKTFIYDVFFDDLNNQVVIYAPKLLNFESILDHWKPRLDGIHHSHWIINKFKRYDVIRIKTTGAARNFSFNLFDKEYDINLSKSDHDKFKNLNVICTLSKNNKMEWIRDWMVHHHQTQAASGLILFDNGSNIYSIEQLREFVSSVPGFKAIEVVSAPLPFGPPTASARAKFLQAALLNLARARFLNRANSVLCIDIDELVFSKCGKNIFQYTQQNPLGFVAFNGEWRYTKTTNSLIRHADHTWKNVEDEKCASKYCYDPKGLLGRMDLDVHGLTLFGRKLFPASKEFSFLHCRSINTAWKNSRKNSENLIIDKMLTEN